MKSAVPDKLSLPLDDLLNGLRAAGEATRVRLLALLRQSELTVKDATTILGQSQPRISRHLKLLTEAGLVQRFPEGSWVYYRLADNAQGGLVEAFLSRLDEDDAIVARDRERLDAIKHAQAEAAAAYFRAHAEVWDSLRTFHIAEDAVESAMREALGEEHFSSMLDMGTGTGRVLELFADLYDSGLGVDTSHDMLRVARANIERAGMHAAQVRHGDIYSLPVTGQRFDVVTFHQVLHYLEDAPGALVEAARVLKPGGRLLVVDFAPHELEFLRTDHAHRRLGFSHEQMAGWLEAAGLELVSVRDLPPPAERSNDAGDPLTVTLWLAREPGVSSRSQVAAQPAKEVA